MIGSAARSSAVVALGSAVMVVAACGGRTDGGTTSASGGTGESGGADMTGGSAGIGGTGGATTGGGGGASGSGSGVTGGSAGTGMGDGSNTCPSSCQLPASPVTVDTLGGMYDAVSGRWLVCGDVRETFNRGAPMDAVGVEFEALPNGGSGKMYYLITGPMGPVRGSGFSYELTYDISPLGTQAFQLNIHPAPNAGFGGSPRYSACPRQLTMFMSTQGSQALLSSIP